MHKILMLSTADLELLASALGHRHEHGPAEVREPTQDLFRALVSYLRSLDGTDEVVAHEVTPKMLLPVMVSRNDFEQARWKAKGRI